MRHLRPPEEGNTLDLLVHEVKTTTGFSSNQCFVKAHIQGYDVQDLLIQILEDIGMEGVIDHLNDLRTENESSWMIKIYK